MFYPMDDIENFRDLGGIKTRDGRTIKEGKLFRSGGLAGATPEDIGRMKELGITTIVDFRSTEESRSRQDPLWEGIDYHHIPLFKEKLEGVERSGKEERFYEWMIRHSYDHPDLFAENMEMNYAILISEEQAVQGYRRFFRILLDDDTDTVLWHCSVGKDRTGIAAILLLEALDADREMIRNDYLLTNQYLGKTSDEIFQAVKEMAGEHENYEKIRDSFKTALSASERFIDMCYKTMNEKAGSPEAYLKEYFGVDDAAKTKLKEKYCE